ncbi:hypothetical protein ACU045_10525 [Microbacterium sp. MAHUQ-60]|uniref:hypothetical protein n=1 Tax=unclassified Microbacterium TaxID=2609290 RepID=UPI00360FA761
MDASRFTSARLHRLAALALAFPLALTACSAPHSPASTSPADESTSASAVESPPAAAATGDAGATFRIGGDTFEFSPMTCLVGEEDIVVQGPGRNTGNGEIAFLDVDLTAYEGSHVGGADIELGTDRPFTSPDDFYRLDALVDDAGFALSLDGESFTVDGTFYGHGSARLPDGDSAPGVLTVRCDGT